VCADDDSLLLTRGRKLRLGKRYRGPLTPSGAECAPDSAQDDRRFGGYG
jgi:hypothetical protein